MFAQVVLKLIGPMDQLRLVWQTGETLLDSMVFEEDQEGTRYNVLLALQEMVTNVLRHAYECDESRPIEIEFTLRQDAFEVVLRDQGPAFDPLAQEVPEPTGGMPDEAGGYGIYIARMVMDEVAYQRRGGANELRLTKYARVASAAR